ncbi:MAG: hypothetical protein CL816_08050 [Coxiellaceae bacterium]|nr:hypothetical protein [Coxiellaceae bacterium]|tara:strand:- start:3049 stop:4368 length:1320 start_codon:yes stop_codon:yes gene_type:complete
MKLQRIPEACTMHEEPLTLKSVKSASSHLIICIISKLGQLDILIDADHGLWKTSKVTRVLVVNEAILSDISGDILRCFDNVIPLTTRSDRVLFPEFYPQQLREIFISQQEVYNTKETIVFCGGEGNITHVAKALDGLSMTGVNAEKAILFRDKTRMKAYLRSYGILVPEFIVEIENKTFDQMKQALGLPFVIKPADEGGSMGFHLIHNECDYLKAIGCIENLANYQAETYLDGQLFHVDSIRSSGEKTISLVSEYLFPMAQCLDGMPAGSMALDQQSVTAQKILSVHQDVLAAFDVFGIFHAEYFITSTGRVVFLEIAWRPCGPPCDQNFLHYVGTNQSTAYLSMATHMMSSVDISFQQPLTMRIFINRQPGVYQGLSLPLPEDSYTVLEEISKGDVCEKGATYMNYVAIIDVRANSLPELRAYFDVIRQSGLSCAVFT